MNRFLISCEITCCQLEGFSPISRNISNTLFTQRYISTIYIYLRIYGHINILTEVNTYQHPAKMTNGLSYCAHNHCSNLLMPFPSLHTWTRTHSCPSDPAATALTATLNERWHRAMKSTCEERCWIAAGAEHIINYTRVDCDPLCKQGQNIISRSNLGRNMLEFMNGLSFSQFE